MSIEISTSYHFILADEFMQAIDYRWLALSDRDICTVQYTLVLNNC
jgi:hypothetical protein